MSNQSKILQFVVIFFSGIVVLYFFFQSTSLEQVSAQPINQKTTERGAITENKQLGRSESDPAPSESQLLQMIERVPKAKGMYEAGKLSNLDIEFYGKVIDQHGNPVAGARVGVSLLRWRILDAGGEFHEFTTDSEGYFDVSGVSGQVLTITSISKNGYEIIGGHQQSQTFRVEGIKKKNESNPYIFHAWKKTEAQHLFYGEIFQKFSQDGQYHNIEIPGFNKTMKVAFTIDSNGTSPNPLDWTVRFKVDGGGVSESTEAFMNEAPESNYLRVWNAEHRKEIAGFGKRDKRKFYLKGLNGNIYGRMEVEFIAYYSRKPTLNGVGVIDAKYWINPNGSRNLQYDPSKRILLKK